MIEQSTMATDLKSVVSNLYRDYLTDPREVDLLDLGRYVIKTVGGLTITDKTTNTTTAIPDHTHDRIMQGFIKLLGEKLHEDDAAMLNEEYEAAQRLTTESIIALTTLKAKRAETRESFKPTVVVHLEYSISKVLDHTLLSTAIYNVLSGIPQQSDNVTV